MTTTASPKINLLSHLWPSICVFGCMVLITGITYPLLITGAAQVLFPWQANGSLINKLGQPTTDPSSAAGSALIGQNFDQPQYFWPRPSATSPVPYSAFNADKGTGSSGSNLSPANPVFAEAVKARVDALKAADPNNTAPIPVDLITASGSGLDPHESIAAANYQIVRVAQARHADPQRIQQLVVQYTQDRTFGILGEKTVHVLNLNLALDRQFPLPTPATNR